MVLEDVEPGAVGMSADRLRRITPAMQRFVDGGEIAGITWAVARRGRVVERGTVGLRDREAGEPMTHDTIFRIYSMTKPVVTVALLSLYEQGLFQLEEPVATYLPSFASVQVMGADGELTDPARPPSIGDLLAHTSGLTYDFMVDNPVAALYREQRVMNDASRSLAECVEVIAGLPLAFQPGTRWHYSVGIDVAAHLVEVLADQPLGDVLAERLFEPLGMTDTGFGVAEDDLPRLAAMYGLPDLVGRDYHGGMLLEAALAGFNERLDVSDTYPTAPDTMVRGGVGLFSTVGDYLRFAQALLEGGALDGARVLGPKTVQLMTADRLPASWRPMEIMGRLIPGFGFGLGSRVMVDLGASEGPGSVGEFGWSGAAKTTFWVDPAEQLVAVQMMQYMTGVQLPDRTFRTLVHQAVDC